MIFYHNIYTCDAIWENSLDVAKTAFWKWLLIFPHIILGGHWPRKGVWGCAAVMTPLFQASRRSLAYQFTITAPLLCPPFSDFRKFFHFQPCFGQNFSSQDANFPKFCSLDPSFFKENPLPRPYFWKPVWHIPIKKKLRSPPRAYNVPSTPKM